MRLLNLLILLRYGFGLEGKTQEHNPVFEISSNLFESENNLVFLFVNSYIRVLQFLQLESLKYSFQVKRGK
jgi:hypothetical protein